MSPSPEGFTDAEWAALGNHRCPGYKGCQCRECCGAEPKYLGMRRPLRVVEPPPEPVINRTPARQPWDPRPSRHLRSAA